MIIPSPSSSVAVYVFGFPIYWYGIIMACAIVIGVFCAEYIAKGFRKGFFIENAPLYIMVGLMGARVYHCVLNFSYYVQCPLEIFAIRHGGLSIHGMILFGALYTWFLVKSDKIMFFKLADVFACVLPLCQSIGRWGNFFNSEAFGLPTDQTWGLFVDVMNRPANYMSKSLVHPTFLYESVLDFALFIVLLCVYKKSDRYGFVFFLYLILYSIIRIFIEQLRVDSILNVFGIPIAQLVSGLLILVGIVGLIYLFKKRD